MAHSVVPAAEAILDTVVPVHTHGFVILVDYLGGDARIAEAARTSTQVVGKGMRDDARLIRRLIRDEHSSPQEFPVLLFHINAPIGVVIQFLRHRTAHFATINSESSRYHDIDAGVHYIPAPDYLTKQDPVNKQMRTADRFDPGEEARLLEKIAEGQERAAYIYNVLRMGDNDVARELAKFNLTLGTYIQIYYQLDAHNLGHFLGLRLADDCQWETRDYARVMDTMLAAVCPIAHAALAEYRWGAMTFARTEWELVKRAIDPDLLATLATTLTATERKHLLEKIT